MAYYLSLTFTKVSILLQYLRIFPPGSQSNRFRMMCFAVLGLVSVYGAWTFFGSIFECWPIPYFWDKSIDGHCMNQYIVWFFNAGVNIATDFIIVILPIAQIRQLNLPKRQKRLLIIVFGLAGLYVPSRDLVLIFLRNGCTRSDQDVLTSYACSVCIVSILRLQSLVTISNSEDPTYDNGPAATWSSIEANVGITCACLPPLRPLISRFAPTFFPGSRGSRRGDYGYGGSLSRRADRNYSSHMPLSSSSNKRVSDKFKGYLPQRSATSGNDNSSEEEIIGFKDMMANPPSKIGVQPATVSAPRHVFDDSGSQRSAPSSTWLQKPLPAYRTLSVSADSAQRNGSANSLGVWDQRAPEGNEIQVVTRMQQSVEMNSDPSVAPSRAK